METITTQINETTWTVSTPELAVSVTISLENGRHHTTVNGDEVAGSVETFRIAEIRAIEFLQDTMTAKQNGWTVNAFREIKMARRYMDNLLGCMRRGTSTHFPLPENRKFFINSLKQLAKMGCREEAQAILSEFASSQQTPAFKIGITEKNKIWGQLDVAYEAKKTCGMYTGTYTEAHLEYLEDILDWQVGLMTAEQHIEFRKIIAEQGL